MDNICSLIYKEIKAINKERTDRRRRALMPYKIAAIFFVAVMMIAMIVDGNSWIRAIAFSISIIFIVLIFVQLENGWKKEFLDGIFREEKLAIIAETRNVFSKYGINDEMRVNHLKAEIEQRNLADEKRAEGRFSVTKTLFKKGVYVPFTALFACILNKLEIIFPTESLGKIVAVVVCLLLLFFSAALGTLVFFSTFDLQEFLSPEMKYRRFVYRSLIDVQLFGQTPK